MFKVTHVFDCGSQVNSATFSSDGKLFASALDNGTIKVWHTKGTLLHTLCGGHDEPVDCITFSPNNKLLMSASDFGVEKPIQIWDVENGKIQEELKHYFGPVAFSPDSTVQAFCSGQGEVHLRGAVNKRLEIVDPHGPRLRYKKSYKMLEGWPMVQVLAFSPNGSVLACGLDNGMFKLWNMVSEYTEGYPGHEDSITVLAFSQNGEIMASATESGEIKLWDTKNVCCIKTVQRSSVGVRSLLFSSDCKLLASVSFNDHIRLWDLAQEEPLREIQATGPIVALLFSRSIRVGVCDDQAQGSYSIKICEIPI